MAEGLIMGNEAKTENLVREYLRGQGYYDNTNIKVEEKKSANPRIDKLLKMLPRKELDRVILNS
jgi:hypothetical protein